MLTLGSLSFAVPWALAALAVLPVIWWLLRITPPAPARRRFPPVRLLLALVSREESAAKTPPWLLALRLALAAAVIAAAAHPLLNAGSPLRGQGPLILVIDDGWAAAADWPARRAMATSLLDEAERQGRGVVVATTAPAAGEARAQPPQTIQRPADARRLIEGLQPKPWAARRQEVADALAGDGGLDLDKPGHSVWLSDGLDNGDAEFLAKALVRLGTVNVVGDAGERFTAVLRPPVPDGDTLIVKAERAVAEGAASAPVSAIAEDGTVLAREVLHFAAGEAATDVRLDLPTELRNRLVRLEIDGAGTAAGVVLIDERWRRRPVGLYSGAGALADQPLLSETYYLERALDPFTEVRRGAVAELLRRQLAVLVLADPGRLEAADRQAVERWIAKGGVAVRFAGPRLAQDTDVLLPVRLREGDRAMGGAMSWNRPARLAAFREGSPFFGIEVPDGVFVQSQVLAQPSLDLADRTWAELNDGTPLVSAEKRGEGWLVLVHTTANTAWTNLPLSGLFVEMLKRLVDLSQGVVAKAEAPLPPMQVLDGFGRLTAAPASAKAIAAGTFTDAVAGPAHPPGYYGDKASRRALNLTAALPAPKALGTLPAGIARAAYGEAREVDLRPWLLMAALLLAVADLAILMAMRRLIPYFSAAAGILFVLVSGGTATAETADDFILSASLTTRLAYVMTGNREVDRTSHAGLSGLTLIVNRRTAAEIGEPIAVSPDADELSFFPFLYWPVTKGHEPPSAGAVARLNAYLRSGGTIFFDTRGGEDGSGTADLRQMARNLDIPSLEPIPADHVLGRAYYLMSEFPGRWTGRALWVERAGERINDGVSSVIVGSHDWAAAWAVDEAQRPLYAAVPGGERQREWAFRFGINLVMYTLTGNYKADQVHLPAIIQRLGQ